MPSLMSRLDRLDKVAPTKPTLPPFCYYVFSTDTEQELHDRQIEEYERYRHAYKDRHKIVAQIDNVDDFIAYAEKHDKKLLDPLYFDVVDNDHNIIRPTDKKRPNESRFKGGLETDTAKQVANREQAPYNADTQAKITEVGNNE